MSLDLSLSAVRPCTVFDANITHNLAKMAGAASLYGLLWGSHGKVAGDLIEPLKAGLIELVLHPEKYRAFEPPNGWGSYAGLVAFTQEFFNACVENPDAIVGVHA